MSDASARGWGRGWPTNRQADMVWVRAPISGARWEVHRKVAPLLTYIVAEAERRGYLFDHGPGDVDDDWGYANRPIRGTRTPSNHSWGLAVDIDAQQYPQGQRRKVPPAWLISLFGQWGWSWGGGWSYADPMHFEVLGTPAQVDWMVAALAASHLQQRPVPVPPGTPSPVVPAPPAPAAPLAGGKPMQIVHVPDNPTQVNPDTWWITDGVEARTLAPGEPEWFAMSGLVNQPVIAAGKVRPVPMPWSMFSRLRR